MKRNACLLRPMETKREPLTAVYRHFSKNHANFDS